LRVLCYRRRTRSDDGGPGVISDARKEGGRGGPLPYHGSVSDSLQRLSPDDLERFRQEFLAAVPDADPLSQCWVVAREICRAILGIDWARRSLTSPDPYFLMEAPDGSLESWMRTHRVIQFGRHLYDLQHLAFFTDLVSDLRTMDLVGASTELHVAHLLTQNGHTVRFVARRGTKGTDFDQLLTYRGTEMSVEVKTKQDVTSYTRATLDRSIKAARAQLPSTGPGLVFVQVPTTWVSAPAFQSEIEDLLAYHFRNGRRTNGIIILWDEWIPQANGGMAYLRRFNIRENPNPKVQVPGLQSLLQPVGLVTDS